jgi:hypothetical protein
MGLKFGFHYMRGIPRQAVQAMTAIADSEFTAADAGDRRNTCSWCPDMYGVSNNAAGQAWYDAMFKLYASWGLDFIKVDDLSNPYDPFRQHEVEMIRRAIDKCGRAIVLSTSAGPTPVNKSAHVQTNANICIRSKAGGNDRGSRYTHDEQIALLSFWCLAPSPLMLGGNLPDNTDWDLSLLTNDEVLALDQDPAVKPAARLGSSGAAQGRTEVWLRELKDGSRAAGLFNRGETPEQATLMWDQAGLNGKWSVRDLWQRKDLGAFEGQFSAQVPAHGAVLLRAVRSTATTQ